MPGQVLPEHLPAQVLEMPVPLLRVRDQSQVHFLQVWLPIKCDPDLHNRLPSGVLWRPIDQAVPPVLEPVPDLPADQHWLYLVPG